MKAYILDAYGKTQTLRLADVPDPRPAAGEVVVAIHATGLNMLDSKLRDGEFKPILPYKPPFILGHDLAGVVEAVGVGVGRYKVGDAVFARVRDHAIGTFAEKIAVREADLAPKPATLSMAEAASLPLVALTAWQALVELGTLRKGQKVLIEAGSGGVGTVAIQLARHLGASVTATTSGRNADLVRSLGADTVIDYTREDFTETQSGYDLVLHSLDTATLAKAVKVVKRGGMLISISGPPTAAFARAQGLNIVLRLVLGLVSGGIRRKAKRAGIDYRFLFMRADGAQLAEIGGLVDQGTIRPVVDTVYPFDRLNDAVAYIETGRARGKVVVEVQPADAVAS